LYFRSPELRAAVRRTVRPGRFDVIHAMTIRVAPAVLDAVDVPVVVDFMDSYVANIETRRLHVGPLARRVYDFELPRVARYEREVAARAAGGIVIAALDREAIGDPRLAIIPNGVDIDALPYHDSEREPATVVFTGNMGYQPNVDAVTWFAAQCWPAVRARVPNARFMIVGARPAPGVTALARLPGIEVTGRVESMAPYLNRAAVAVCPIRCGSGMQNKVLEAMAAGVPLVTTAFANRSIGADGGREARVVADGDAAGFVDATLDLLGNPAAGRRQAEAARGFVEAGFAWSHRADQLVAVFEAAIDGYRRANRLKNAG
jgi:glycosyltransferase involved in cell wall biosynthesis